MRRKVVAGNWKMNGLVSGIAEAQALGSRSDAGCDTLICPPATLLAPLTVALSGSGIMTGGQDCHAKSSGAHTGDISAQMIADAGGSAVIVGHSERRADHSESDALVRAKALAAWESGLIAIICIGETEAQRDGGQHLTVAGTQLAASVPDGATAANTIIAYEPVWAIGTGRTASPADIAEVHDSIRGHLVTRFGVEGEGMRVLYGGSVKPANAVEIFATSNVDGALVGGASLKAADFGPIIDAAGGN